MISDLNRSLGPRQFLNVAFASCARAFISTRSFTCLESTSDLKVTHVFVAFLMI